jgi:hypothetical protein
MSLGRDRKLYVNTATPDSPTWVLCGRVENVTRPRSQATTEHDFRESTHTKTVAGNVKMGLEFEYFERPDGQSDPVLAKLIAAAENGELIHVAIVAGEIGTDPGIQGIYVISDSPVEEPTNDRVKHSFTLAEADAYVDGEVFDVQAI